MLQVGRLAEGEIMTILRDGEAATTTLVDDADLRQLASSPLPLSTLALGLASGLLRRGQRPLQLLTALQRADAGEKVLEVRSAACPLASPGSDTLIGSESRSIDELAQDVST